jgi:hypothetical protein
MVVLGTDSSRKAAFATPGRPLKKRSELSLTAQFGPILPVQVPDPGGIPGRESAGNIVRPVYANRQAFVRGLGTV